MLVRVVSSQLLADLSCAWRALKQTTVQHDGGGHALAVVIDDGHEHRGLGKAADPLHLGQVLVREVEAVDTGSVEGAIAPVCLVAGDHAFATARVAREGEAAEGIVGGQDAHADERRRDRDEAGGMAARVGDAPARGDGAALPQRELGKAVDPPVGGAMCRRGVDDTDVGVLNERDRLACSFVG